MINDETSEEVQMLLDLELYGCYVSLDGKRIDPRDVYIDPSEETLSEEHRERGESHSRLNAANQNK